MSKLYDRNKMYMNSVVFRISLLVYFISIFNYYINKDAIKYYIFINYFISIAGLALIFIKLVTDIKHDKKFIDYLVVGYLYNNILILISTQIISYDNLHILIFQNTSINKFIFLYISYCYQVVIIPISLICYKRLIGKIKTSIIHLVCIIIIWYLSYQVLNMSTINGTIFMEISLIIIIIVTLKNNENMEMLKEDNYLKSYLVLLLIMSLMLILFKWFRILEPVYIMYTLKVIAYSIIYVKIENEMIIEPRIKELKEINEAKANRSNLNIALNNKEKILKELKEKSKHSLSRTLDIMDNIVNGILIFENDELTYINDEGKRYIRHFYDENTTLSFKRCIENLTGVIIDNNSNIGFTNNIMYIDEYYKINEIEVSTKLIDRSSYVVLIKNNTDSKENIKIKEVYDSYIKEEEMREEFYSNVSHELRTPINVIFTAIQFNENIIDDEDKDLVTYRNNRVIKQNCNRLIRTINNFIDTNKITAGYFQGNKETINLVYLVDDIVQASSYYVEMKNSRLIYDPQEEEIYITCNIDSIKRILFNLISNSLKYGEDNGNIFIVTKVVNKKVELEVKYKGEKIPEDKILYIFEKFTKLDKYLTRGAEGSGLGLYLTKKFVEQHGGKIEIFSDDNGNVFKITLPISNDNINNNSSTLSFNNLKEQVDIEFSDIYF